jgi:branched-chain amino acid transport system substrate-binding protein
MRRRNFVVACVALLSLPVLRAASGAEDIKVGVTVSLSGRYAAPARDQFEGIEMWASDLNARGALLGRKVSVVHYDDQSDPQKVAQLYQRLINEDRVELLLGPYSSELTLAASDVAEKYGIPMVATGAASSEIWSRGYRNIFQVDSPARAYMDVVLDFVNAKGLRRIALLYAKEVFPREVADGVRAKAAQNGMEIVFDEQYDPQRPDFQKRIQRMRASRPEVVVGGTYLEDSVALVQHAKAQRLAPKVLALTVGPALAEFGRKLGPDAEGVMGVVAWMPSARLPRAQDFSYRYKRKFGHDAGVHAAYGYGAGQVLEAAVRLAGSLDRDKLRKQLRTMKFRSLLGRYAVDETGKQIAKSVYAMQWQDEKRVLVLPDQVAEAPVEYPFTPWSQR